MEITNAIIQKSSLTKEDHNVLSGWLYLEYDGYGQGFGGYSIYLPKDFKNNKHQANYTCHFIFRCMEIAGVNKWEDMAGKTIRVNRDSNKI